MVSPWEAAGYYDKLPFHFPQIDIQPIVRIPVVGPDQFNTLVVVRQAVYVGPLDYSNGKLRRCEWEFPTIYTAIGFDPRRPSPSAHSSTLVLHMLQTTSDATFVTAVDAVKDGFFDQSGRWILRISTADLWESDGLTKGTVAQASGYLSSWVLCFEPPVDPRIPDFKARAYNPLPKALGGFAGQEGGDPTPAGINLARYLRKSVRERQKRLILCKAGKD